ncbi:hypothetical protein SAMN04488038_11813 [Solimonas aquatica]|uniref:Uncharacterized protein n=2 Tax=Solimonas aquatica TaxID=489703 RepID=A0A1H9M1H0_9GAMM|nr:hypothetical protein SAMN04488038_11813 [Solimonas aquatica]
MHDREAVFKIATRETYFDFSELQALQNATSNIPLHELPHSLVSLAMVLGATVRQYAQLVDMAVARHRSMNADEFAHLFTTLREITASLEATRDDVNALKKADGDA